MCIDFISWGFPAGSDSKVSAHDAGDPGSMPGLGRSPGEGNGNPLQYSCLENSMDGGAWWATVHGVTKSRTWLSDFTHFTSCDLTQMCLLVYYQIFQVECLCFPSYRTKSSMNKDNLYLPFQLPAPLATMFCAILSRSNDSNSRFWFFFPSGYCYCCNF